MPKPLTDEELEAILGEPIGASPVQPPATEPEDSSEPRQGDVSGRTKYDYAGAATDLTSADVEELVALQEDAMRLEGVPEVRIVENSRKLRDRYSVVGQRGTAEPEAATELIEAYRDPMAPGAARTRVAAGAIPIVATSPIPPADERWRQEARALSGASFMDAYEGIGAAADRAAREAAAEGAAVDKPWVPLAVSSALKGTAGAMQAMTGLSALDSIVNAAGGDIPGVYTLQELADLPSDVSGALEGAEADPDAEVLASPSKLGKVGGRAVLALGLPEIEAAIAEKAGADPRAVKALRQGIEDASTNAAFDAAAAALYEGNDAAALDALPYEDLPASMQRPVDADLLRAAATSGVLAGDPAVARLARAAESGASDEVVRAEAMRLPLSALSRALPGTVPTGEEMLATYKRRKVFQDATGTPETDAFLRMMQAGLVDRVEGEDGTILYKPSKVQRFMAWAGILPELAWEADIPTGGIINPLPPVLDLLGMDQAATAIRASRVPTKAGWESWVATGTLDPYLHEWGYLGSEAPLLRPGADTTWSGRVLANVAMPDYQSPGLYDALLRQGEPEHTPLAKWALAADTIVDVAVPIDDVVLMGMGAPVTAARRAWVGGNTARRAGLRGTNVARAAVSSAFPAVAGKSDSLAGLHAAVAEGLVREVEAGHRVFNDLKPDSRPPPKGTPAGQVDWKVERDVAQKLAAAGLDPVQIAREVNAVAAERAREVVDDVAVMLARGGGPADVALRASPSYQRVKGRYADAVAAGHLSPRDADATMAVLEHAAWRATGEGKVGAPEEFFDLHDVELGGSPGAGAYFQVDASSSPDEVLAELDKMGFIPFRQFLNILGPSRPGHLDAVANYIIKQRDKLRSGSLTRRDVAKAYLLTLSSIQQSELPLATLARKGDVSFVRSGIDTVLDRHGAVAVRPEDYAAAWMLSPDGRRVLDNIEAGTFTPEDYAAVEKVRRIYSSNTFDNAFKVPSKKAYTLRNLDEATAAINAARGDPADLAKVLSRFMGVKDQKYPFMGQLLGLGDAPTLDSVDINGLITGKGRLPATAPPGKEGRRVALAQAVKAAGSPRVQEKMRSNWESFIDRAVRRKAPGTEGIDPSTVGAILHHWFWDKLKGATTPHTGMYEAMLVAEPTAPYARATEPHPADTVTPPESGPVRWDMPLDEVESVIADKPEEHVVMFGADGRQIARLGPEDTRAAGADPRTQCVILPEALDALRADGNGLYTHNHPSGRPPSFEDIAVAVKANVAELRAVADGKGFTWVIRRPAGGWPVDLRPVRAWFDRTWGEAFRVASRRMDAHVATAGYDDALWKEWTTDAYIAEVERDPIPLGLAIERADHRQLGLGPGVQGVAGAAADGPEAAGAAARAATPVGGQVRLLEPTADYDRPLAPTFYSALRRAVEGMKQERFTADQLRASLRNAPGVKADEIEWTRLDDFLRANPRPSKAETLAWLDENAVRVEEVMLGGADGRASPQFIEGPFQDRDSALEFLQHEVAMPGAYVEESPEGFNIVSAGGETAYASEKLPGGSNYREILFRLPSGAPPARARAEAFKQAMITKYGERYDGSDLTNYDWYERLDQRDAAEWDRLVKASNEAAAAEPRYTAPHFDDLGENLLAHARVNDRTLADGRRVLHVEELQSDWHQAGRDKGYKGDSDAELLAAQAAEADAEKALDEWDEAHPIGSADYDPRARSNLRARLQTAVERRAAAWRADDARVAAAPFSKSWLDLAFKRILRMAAEGGYDGVTWTPGIEQVKRYSDATRQAVDEIRWARPRAGNIEAVSAALARAEAAGDAGEVARLRRNLANMEADPDFVTVTGIKDGAHVYVESLPPGDVASVLGKGMANKIASDPATSGVLSGDDLTVGGEGFKEFYDRAFVPKVAEKLTGSKVERVEITTGKKKHATAMVHEDDAGDGWTVSRYDGDEPPGDEYDWEEVATGMSKAEATALARKIKAEQKVGHRIDVPFVALTPATRDRVLYAGQPLFERRAGQVLGSIEPVAPSAATRAADYLVRFFKGADVDTVFHENAHLLRFVMGDDWTDALVTFFDAVPDPARPGKMKLTREGEERAAEALSRYLRWKVAPRGRLGAFLAEARDTLSDLWMRGRVLPLGMTSKARAWMDAAMNPGAPLRRVAATVAGDRNPGIPIATTVDVDVPTRLEAELVKRTGQVLGDVSTVASPGEMIDAVVGSRSARSVDAVEAAARAVADAAVETARRKWGFAGEAAQLTRRTVVPVGRKREVLAAADRAMSAAVADVRPFLSGTTIKLPAAEAARMKAHVNWLLDTGKGFDAIGRTPLATPGRDFSTLSVDEYNRIREATIDDVAGPGSRSDRVAAENVGNAAHGLMSYIASSGELGGAIGGAALGTALAGPGLGTLIGAAGGAILNSERVARTMKEYFVVNFKAREAASPRVAAAYERVTRDLGDLPARFVRAIDAVKVKDPRASRAEIVTAIARGLPAHAVNAADARDALDLWDDWRGRPRGEATVAGQAKGMKTVADLLASLDRVAGLFARNAPVSSSTREAEREAIVFLQGWKASPQDLATLGDADRWRLEDAIGIASDGLRRRWEAVEQAAVEIGVAMSGDRAEKVWVGLKKSKQRDLIASVYADFFDGKWNDIMANMHAMGLATSPQSRFDPVAAGVATVTRLMGLHVLDSFAREMLDLGIALDVDTAGRAGRQFEAFVPIGATSMDRAAFTGDVLHYLQAETSWKMVGQVVFDPDARKVTERVDAFGLAAPSGGFNADAYRVAQSILASWGFKHGVDTEWKPVVLATGDEVLVPAGLWTELQGSMDRAAKSGLAWLSQREGGSLPVLGRFYDVKRDVRKAVAERALAAENTVQKRLAQLVDTILDAAGWTYSMGRVNMTTGVGIPNPANFIGNILGGAIQAYQGKGVVGTVRLMGRYGTPTPSGAMARQVFMSLFRDYRGGPFVSLWKRERTWVDGRGMVWTVEALVEAARRQGLHTSMARSESASSLLRALIDNEGSFIDRLKRDSLLRNMVAKPFNYWQDILMEVSTGIDNLYRVGAFIDELSIGKAEAEAAEAARRVAFDYNAVTDFEREVMRPAIMFYTYTRRNLDLQWWTMLNHPSRFLGSLRGIRDAQEIVLGDESEVLWPEYLDGRLVVGMRRDAREGNAAAYDGLGKIAPPIPPSDAVVLMARVMGATTGDEEAKRETVSMLSPWFQAPVVLGIEYDIFAGRELDAFNTVPAWLVEIDRQALGGLLTDDIFAVDYIQQRDPLQESAPSAPRWQARNAGYWWAFRNLMPIAGGRTVDTITAMARADWLAGLFDQGVVQAVVNVTREARQSGLLSPVDPLVDAARATADYLPGIDPGARVDWPPSPREDTDESRVLMSRDDELWGLFGFKPVLFPSRALRLDDIAMQRKRDLADERARARQSEPHAQGR